MKNTFRTRIKPSAILSLLSVLCLTAAVFAAAFPAFAEPQKPTTGDPATDFDPITSELPPTTVMHGSSVPVSSLTGSVTTDIPATDVPVTDVPVTDVPATDTPVIGEPAIDTGDVWDTGDQWDTGDGSEDETDSPIPVTVPTTTTRRPWTTTAVISTNALSSAGLILSTDPVTGFTSPVAPATDPANPVTIPVTEAVTTENNGESARVTANLAAKVIAIVSAVFLVLLIGGALAFFFTGKNG